MVLQPISIKKLLKCNIGNLIFLHNAVNLNDIEVKVGSNESYYHNLCAILESWNVNELTCIYPFAYFVIFHLNHCNKIFPQLYKFHEPI